MQCDRKRLPQSEDALQLVCVLLQGGGKCPEMLHPGSGKKNTHRYMARVDGRMQLHVRGYASLADSASSGAAGDCSRRSTLPSSRPDQW